MATKLAYQSSKWEKELRNKEKVWKQLNGQMAAQNNLTALIKRNETKDSSQRDYCQIYSNIHLKYQIIAGNLYLRGQQDTHCLDYCYLSGMSGVFSHLFDTLEMQSRRDTTEQQNAIKDFAFSLLQLYAVNQPIPPCVQKMDHLYVKLLMGDFERVNSLLLETGTEFDSENPHKLWVGVTERTIIQSLIDKDEAALQKAITARIREYRKWPVGYSTFIDVYSIAMIKLAYRHGMHCEIDVIEIPKFFFDEEVCSIDNTEIKIPFFDDALEQLKKLGIIWP